MAKDNGERGEFFRWFIGIVIVVLMAVIGFNYRWDYAQAEKIAAVPCRAEVNDSQKTLKADVEKRHDELKTDILRILNEMKTDQKDALDKMQLQQDDMKRKVDRLYNRFSMGGSLITPP
jgi:hypothetical protein